MSKRNLSIVLAVGGILLIGLVLWLVVKRNKNEGVIVQPATGEISRSLSGVKEELKTYTDEAGFSFSYPASLKVTEVPDQDQNTYSWLEMAAPEKPNEKITIKVTDTTDSLTSWLAKNSQNNWPSSEAVLGDINGKLIKGEKKTFLAAISRGILFLIEAPAEQSGWWEGRLQTVIGSFKIQWPAAAKSSGSSTSTSGDVEEVIE